MIRKTILSSLVAGASALPLAAAGALAQDDAGAETEVRDVITVTAQRREQSLVDVPISVTAFDGGRLEEIGAPDITAINDLTPNVTVEVSRGTNTTLTAFIRGVGQQDPVSGFEQGVGVYIDDVYLSRPQAAVLDIYDVERIEVLRGPQGTLYGRNTIGGAIKYVTRRLDPDAPTLDATVKVGTFNQFDTILTASAPLNENFRIGGSVARLTRGGFGENLFLGQQNYNKDLWAGRFSAEADLNPAIFMRLTADYVDDGSNARQGRRLLDDQFPPFEFPALDDEFDTRAGLNVTDQNVTGFGVAHTTEIEVSENWAIKNIFSYREDESSTPIDFDSLPAADLDVPAIYENQQLSEEIQLSYTSDKLNGLIGFYYLTAESTTAFDVLLGLTGDLVGSPGLNAQTFGNVETDTWSVFADFTYDIADRWHLSLGGRYTDDRRGSVVRRTTFVNGFSDLFGGSGIPVAVTSDFEGEAEFTDFSPRVSLAYDLTDTHNLYFTYSQGFKGGGFDPRGQTSIAPDLNGDGVSGAAGDLDDQRDFLQFEPEEVDSFEIGLKGTVNGFTYALAAFYADYKDVQIPGSIGLDSDGDGINDTFVGVTTNAAAATIMGIEFEGFGTLAEDIARSGDSLNLAWTLGYLDASYDEYTNAQGIDVSDIADVQNTPDFTGSLTLDYVTPFYKGDLTFIGSVSHRSETRQFEFPSPIDQGAYTLLNASAVYADEGGRWDLAVHARNLTDERYIVAGYDFFTPPFTPLGLEGTLTAFYGDPRTVTGVIRYRY